MTMKAQLKTYGMQQFKEEFMEIRSYLKKQEKHQIYNLNLYLKETEKEEQKQLVEGKKS